MDTTHEHRTGRPSGPNWSHINQWLLWIGLAAAVAWMFFRHNAHFVQLLPFLILLACPLLHVFGHGGHGGHSGDGDAKPQDNKQRQTPPPAQGGHQH